MLLQTANCFHSYQRYWRSKTAKSNNKTLHSSWPKSTPIWTFYFTLL